MIAAERLLAATLVYMMLILAGDIETNPGPTLTINNLLDAVDDLNDWMNLGLKLGLCYPTMDRIAEEQRGNISRCKLKMMVAWLELKDNVTQNGAPSWSVLRAALKRIGEHELANRISNGDTPMEVLSPTSSLLSSSSPQPSQDDQYISTSVRMMKERKSLNLRMLHLILHGLPAVGKTCLKLKLTGHELTDRKAAFIDNDKLCYPPDDGACSTLVAENILRARVPDSSIALTGEGPWHLMKFHEEIVRLVKKISGDPEAIEEQPATGVTREQQSADGSAPSPVAPVGKKFFQEMVAKAFEKAPTEKLQEILDRPLIYLIDSGGQPQFQELLPTLVSGPSLFLLTFSLAVDLHDELEVTFSNSDGERFEYPEPTKMTVYNVLQQSLASIHCTCSYQTNGNKKVQVKPRVIFVGTMKRLVSKSKIVKVDKDLEYLCEKFKDREDLIVRPGRGFVYPVDSFHSEGIAELRKAILDVANNTVDKGESIKSPMCEVKLPVPSVALELLLRSEVNSIISLERCQELARDCNIADTDLESVLWQLHHFTGSIRYYSKADNDTLKKYIVTNPQVLYDAPSSLLTRTFAYKTEAECDGADKDMMWRRGVFTESTLSKLWEKKQDLAPGLLIAFLLHLNIIAQIGHDEPGDRKFFMPSALVCARSEKKDGEAVEECANDSALVCFEAGYSPKGMFSSVLAYLLNKKKLDNTYWKLNINSLRSNQATLGVCVSVIDEHFYVTLKVHLRFLEVKVAKNSACTVSRMKKGCEAILRCIQHAVQAVGKDLHYNDRADFKRGLFFPCWCSCIESTPHAAEYDEWKLHDAPSECWIEKWTNGNKSTSETETIVDEQKLVQRPDMCNLLRVLKGEYDKWRILGTELGMDRILGTVDADNMGSVDKMRDMLRQWLAATHTASWHDVMIALENIELMTIATNCEKDYCGGISEEGKKRRARKEHQQLKTKEQNKIDHLQVNVKIDPYLVMAIVIFLAVIVAFIFH